MDIEEVLQMALATIESKDKRIEKLQKRIEELERENKKFTDKFENKGTLHFIVKLDEVEEENTELKERVKDFNKEINRTIDRHTYNITEECSLNKWEVLELSDVKMALQLLNKKDNE